MPIFTRLVEEKIIRNYKGINYKRPTYLVAAELHIVIISEWNFNELVVSF